MDDRGSATAEWYAHLLTALERFAVKHGLPQGRAEEFSAYITSEVYLQEPDAPDGHAFIVNPERFRKYCWQLAKFRVNDGKWYPRPGERSLDGPDANFDDEGKSSIDPADPHSQEGSDAVDNRDFFDHYIRQVEAARPRLDSDHEREVLDRWLQSLKEQDGKSLREITRNMHDEGYRRNDGSPYPETFACAVVAKIMRLVGP